MGPVGYSRKRKIESSLRGVKLGVVLWETKHVIVNGKVEIKVFRKKCIMQDLYVKIK